MKRDADPTAKHTLTISFIEVYNEVIRDLLRNTKSKPEEIKILNDHVVGANTPAIETFEDAIGWLRKGMLLRWQWVILGLGNRETDSTNANEVSSRYATLT